MGSSPTTRQRPQPVGKTLSELFCTKLENCGGYLRLKTTHVLKLRLEVSKGMLSVEILLQKCMVQRKINKYKTACDELCGKKKLRKNGGNKWW